MNPSRSLGLLCLVAAAAAPTGADLCGRLGAAQLGAILGSARTAEAGETLCKFTGTGRPEIRLFASKAGKREAFIKTITALGGKTQDGPGGAVFSSIGFDLKKKKVSGLWLLSRKLPVEMDFDDGLEPAQAAAIAEALSK